MSLIEIWKDIEGYEGIYQVSNKGRVKRLPCSIEMGNQATRWKQPMPELIFKPSLDTKGYPQVGLCIGGKKRVARVHRLDEEALEVYKEACLGRISQEEIALIYGIHQITVSNIKTGRSWSWLTGQEKKARTRRAKQRSLPIAEQTILECH